MVRVWLLFVWFGSMLALVAQGQTPNRKLQLGLGAGGASLAADLTQGSDPAPYGGSWGLVLELATPKAIRPQFNFWFGKTTAQYRDAPFANGGAPAGTTPNTFVETRFLAAFVVIQAVFWRKGPVQPILGIGAGLLSFTPSDAAGAELTLQAETRLEGESYGTNTLALPLSAGLSYQATPKISFQIRYQRWITSSDYLDNIGQVNPTAGSDALNHLQFLALFRLGG
jgi:hypothetical protein